jgi:hypothetical protein
MRIAAIATAFETTTGTTRLVSRRVSDVQETFLERWLERRFLSVLDWLAEHFAHEQSERRQTREIATESAR